MRGFIKNENFNESKTADSDRRILDNLAGAGISSDISLFSNNLRNTSTIASTDYVMNDDVFVIVNPYMLPYANNTIVNYGETEYVVKNSNLKNSFQLFPIGVNSPFVPSSPYLDIIRNDSVTFEDIINLNPQRLETSPSNTAGIGRTVYDPYTYYGINENIDAIVQSTEMLEYKKATALMTDQANTVDAPVVVNGTVVITNTTSSGTPVTGVLDVNADPGMFISSENGKIRAFSDNSQPWTKVAGGLSTNSSNTNIKNLVMTDPAINGITVTEITSETINTSVKNMYYSVPIEIEGETYYLLCKKVI